MLGLLTWRKLKKYPKISTLSDYRVTIVIPTWNNRIILEECLNSLQKFNQINSGFIEILVVDNGSADGTQEFIAKNYPRVKVVALTQNMGFGPAINLGVQQVLSPLVFLMNDDVIVETDFLEPLIKHFSDPLVFAVAPKMILENGEERWGHTAAKFYHGMLNLQALEDNVRYNLFVCGGAGLFRRDYFLALGGFDLIYRPFYYEDVDICYRAWKRGWKLLYEPRSIIYHKQGTTVNKRFSKDYVQDIVRKNMLLFHWKNISDADWLFMHFIFLFLTTLKKILMLDFRGLHYIYLALRQLKSVSTRRKEERLFFKLGDKEVISLVRNGT